VRPRNESVYLKLATWPFSPFLRFRRINNLRIINAGERFEPLPVRQMDSLGLSCDRQRGVRTAHHVYHCPYVAVFSAQRAEQLLS
jgi:hypothetical protein